MTQARQPAHDPSQQITALYQAHALGLVRLAFVMTGDQPTAEDIVQDAFLGLHRRWDTLVDPGKALSYVRSCVLNGCRQIHRVKYRKAKFRLDPPEDIESAEDIAILGEANRAVLAAIRRLPGQTARGRGAPLLPGHVRRPGGPGDGCRPGHREVRHFPGPRRPRSHARGDQVSTEDQMSIEDRVRTATRAGASLIRDVRPLGAPAPVRLRRRPEPAPRRWVNWGVPLAAAAAVVAIALTLVAVRQPGTPSPAASGSGTAAPATIPRYYVASTYDAAAAGTRAADRGR